MFWLVKGSTVIINRKLLVYKMAYSRIKSDHPTYFDEVLNKSLTTSNDETLLYKSYVHMYI